MHSLKKPHFPQQRGLIEIERKKVNRTGCLLPSPPNMASPFYILLLFFLSVPFSESKLSYTYYNKTCPDFPRIVRETIINKQMSSPTTAAGTLRLFFHDCMVEGCDASVLVGTNAFNSAEKDADINLSLPGDAFEVVTRAKTALELSCPRTVSCADILAQATRDLITMVGGPYYDVILGRKDGKVSQSKRVNGNVPEVHMSVDQLIDFFAAKGMSIQDLVALSGAHTIGFSHCKEFSDRLFNHSATTKTDPSMNPKYAEVLKKFCGNYKVETSLSAFNDVFTPGKFDNMYYQNLKRGLGLLATDQALVSHPKTLPFVDLYATNQTAFFNDFVAAMRNVGRIGVKNGLNGEVRNRCDQFNDLDTKINLFG